jgi:hypothetical protein
VTGARLVPAPPGSGARRPRAAAAPTDDHPEDQPVSAPDRPRPVPGPARPSAPAVGTGPAARAAAAGDPVPAHRPTPFDDLAGRPVAEHVGVFEAEHDRLRRELSTIDQL